MPASKCKVERAGVFVHRLVSIESFSDGRYIGLPPQHRLLVLS